MMWMSNKIQIFIITVLLAMDQIAKLLVYANFKHQLDTSIKINPFLTIHPIFNDRINGINALWDLGITRNAYILTVILMLLGYIYLYNYSQLEIYKGDKTKRKWVVMISITISGLLGALCDKFFWGNTLDYISIKGWIFDLKDVYIILGSIGFALIAIIDGIKYKKGGS